MTWVRGFVDPDFTAVTDTLRQVVHGGRRHRGPQGGGAAVAVYLHGELVVDAWTGVRNLAGDPWQRDTLAMSFSTTKGVVATVLHRLADRGLVSYDEPVATYWPEFAAAGKHTITVRQLLSHTAAMHRFRGLVDTADEALDWDHMVTALAAAAPAWAPGVRPGYHAVTFGWLVGEVVRRAGGYSTVTEAVRREIVEPLGTDAMFIGVPPGERGRLAELIGRPPSETAFGRTLTRWSHRPGVQPMADAFDVDGFDRLALSERIHDGEVPAANGSFTARSLARMYAAMVSPEHFDGLPLLSASTVAAASTVQTTVRDAVVRFPMKWRLGYHLAATIRGEIRSGFGHFGYGGSGAWGDPASGLAVGFVLNRVAGTPFADTRFLRIGAAAMAAARRRGT